MDSVSARACAVGACVLGVLALAGTAQAQLMPLGTGVTIIQPGPGTLASWSTASFVGTLDGGHASFNLRGDTTVVRNVPTFGAIVDQVRGFFAYTVGPLPVRLSNVRASWDFKAVNGGGSYNNSPVTSPGIEFRLNELVSLYPNFDGDPFAIGSGFIFNQSTSLVGRGFKVYTDMSGLGVTDGIILGAGIDYYSAISLTTQRDGTPPPGSLTESTTMEFGGPYSSGYGGITFSFDYATVPAPSGAAAIGLAGVLAARRRRA